MRNKLLSSVAHFSPPDDGGGDPGPNFDPNTPQELARARADLKRLRGELTEIRADLVAVQGERDAARAQVTEARALVTTRDQELAVAKAATATREAELTAKYEGEKTTLQADFVKSNIQAEVRVAAIKAGVRDPADFLRLVDLSSVKQKDDGTFEGVDALVTSTKESKAYLFNDQATGTQTGTTGTGQPPPAANLAGAKPVAEMTRDEYRAARGALVGANGRPPS